MNTVFGSLTMLSSVKLDLLHLKITPSSIVLLKFNILSKTNDSEGSLHTVTFVRFQQNSGERENVQCFGDKTREYKMLWTMKVVNLRVEFGREQRRDREYVDRKPGGRARRTFTDVEKKHMK